MGKCINEFNVGVVLKQWLLKWGTWMDLGELTHMFGAD